MKAKITCVFTISNLIDAETLETEYNNDISKAALEMIQEEGLWGLVDDDYKIIDIQRIDE